MEGSYQVFLDAEASFGLTTLGTLHFEAHRHDEISSFEYEKNWLDVGKDLFLDPDLFFFPGRQYPPTDKPTFGMFADSCPDRWGRTLMQRQEAASAAREGRTPRTLITSDHLLGVCDEARMGALRFNRMGEKAYLAECSAKSIPPWVRLRELESAAWALESAKSSDFSENLALLLEPGSSLGGARPKASVQDPEGDLWIAKFPSKNDVFDVGLAEALVYQLAQEFGLKTTEWEVERFGRAGHTFLCKRFDRTGSQRVHFASAMTLLGKHDGEQASLGTSYLDIADFIRERGSQPQEDLRELFKRILFSIAVSNTDDHLRNHGFLLCPDGWKISPLFDVNPNPQGHGLSLNISQHDNSCSFELAVAQAGYFGIASCEADKLVAEAKRVVGGWEALAKRLAVDKASIEFIRPAFKTG